MGGHEALMWATILRDFEGQLWRQAKGIPMGDPHSPGMTIGTCAWMEHEWLQTLDAQTKRLFCARRYMDDVIMVLAKAPRFDWRKFLGDFERSTCYMEPLRLEDGKDATFLETELQLIGGREFRYWLKNENACGRTTVWRYQHFRSHAPYKQKRALVTASLKRVHKMASDTDALRTSAMDKIREFTDLHYPYYLIKNACAHLAATTGERTWLHVGSHY